MDGGEVNVRRLLKDLGKATMRGVRKCPRCATYNGTRGSACKNKSCNHIFKSCSSESKLTSGKKVSRNSLEAVRLVTNSSSSNIYSVRVRDRGPDYRGFVEVPIIQGLDGTSDPSLDASFIAETTAKCFVDVCGTHKTVLPIEQDSSGTSKSTAIRADGSGANGSSTNITLTIIESCLHIKHSVKCSIDASPLTLKNSVLNMLPISAGTREELWMLAHNTPGPMVQRVSKNTMVVKCKANNKHPLGYLHCSFSDANTCDDFLSNSRQPKFSCICKAFRTFKSESDPNKRQSESDHFNTSNSSNSNNQSHSSEVQKKCVHYFACICAFASDANLMKEFAYHVKKEVPQFIIEPDSSQPSNEIMTTVSATSSASAKVLDFNVTSGCNFLLTSNSKRLKKDDGSDCSTSNNTRKLIDRGILSESDIKLSFIDWLASVTELINQTMHYQLNGKPDPLIFMIPQSYFDCLQQRIATGLRKKRLPNITTVFTRKDSPPLGTFTKYSYLITNVIHVKQIFDTPQVQLEITQNFVQNRDGSYDYLNSKSDKSSSVVAPVIDNSLLMSSNNCLIKPSEMKTYLKVGLMSPDQKEAIPFIIEWVPDILPSSQVGELRIQFQFGHLRNQKIEKRD